MTNSMDDDLGLGDLVENQIGKGRYRHAPDGWVVRSPADVGMKQEKIDDGFNACLNAPCTLRRMSRDIIEDCFKFGERRKGIAEPHKPCFDHTARI